MVLETHALLQYLHKAHTYLQGTQTVGPSGHKRSFGFVRDSATNVNVINVPSDDKLCERRSHAFCDISVFRGFSGGAFTGCVIGMLCQRVALIPAPGCIPSTHLYLEYTAVRKVQ